MENPQTIPQYFMQRVTQYGDRKVALRQKELGIWQEFTWQESYEQVRDLGLGLLQLGLQRGDKVATVGDNDRQYLWSYIGLQAIGGAQVGMFTDATSSEMAYIIDHSDAVLVLAKDQEQVDKVLEVKEKVPQVRRIIYWEERGLWHYDDPLLMSFAEVQALGRALHENEPDRFTKEVRIGKGDDLAIICYTSGTTGLPKGAMLAHRNIMLVVGLFDRVDRRLDTDNHVSILPLGWIVENTLGIAPHVYTGMIMNFPEEPETVREDIREIAPEGILYNSRLWDAIVSSVQVRMNDATWFNRKLYDIFLPIGYQVTDKKFANEIIPLSLKLKYKLGDALLYAPLRDSLGLSHIRTAYTAGAALSPDVMRWFHAFGINLKQIYGSTEVTGGATIHYDNDIKFASVGKPAPGIRVKISDSGEIMVGGDTVFQGYYKNPKKTAEDVEVDENGVRWFRTGDAGYIDDDGHIIYLDRLKDMLALANGERFSPQFIEGRLKFSQYIQDVMAIGGETREFVAALIIIAFENMGRWAEKQGIGYTTFMDLSQKPEIYDLVTNAVIEVNESLPKTGRIKRFVLMHKEFDADEAEMTRTRKLRRGVLYDRYDDIIEAIYGGAKSVRVEAVVRYQDGSEATSATEVTIQEV